jgi:hypothetical protein
MMIEGAERETARIAAMKRVPIEEYDGDGFFLDEEYCSDQYELADIIRDKFEMGEEPGYVFSADKCRFDFDAQELVDNALSDISASEYGDYMCLDVKDLQKRLDEWISENPINWYNEGNLVVELSEGWLDSMVRSDER